MYVLEVEHLRSFFNTENGVVRPVRDVSFEVKQGEVLGIVGESGSGKSVTMFSVMGLLAKNGYVGQGRITFNGETLLELKPQTDDVDLHTLRNEKMSYEKRMQDIRGKDIGMIFQDPMTYLNPLLTVGYQMSEGLKRYFHLSNKECRMRNIEMLEMVGITNAEKRLSQYPFELSGGMRQRIMIAMALNSKPKLLIADEPTTALDVTIQAQILELMQSLQKKIGMSIILITHDLGVVASMCTHIIIMYGGQIMEEGSDMDIFYSPRHPYTEGLLKSVATCNDTLEGKRKLEPIPGSPPDLRKPPQGCAFVDRCKYAMKICKAYEPPVVSLSDTHSCKCWRCHPKVMAMEQEG